MQANLARFTELNTQVLGISVDSVFSHRAFATELGGLDFPLLADFHPKGSATKAYGIWNPDWGVSRRAIFLLDEEGVVQYQELIAKGPPDVSHLLDLISSWDEEVRV